jgi:hypothetical protein
VSDFAAIYRAAHYDVFIARDAVATIRIGERAPGAIERWIGDARVAYFVTACNPRSTPLPDDENASRLAALRAELDACGATYLEGVGRDAEDAWREPSLLVRGIDDAAADAIARRWHQHAIVVVRAGEPAVLQFCGGAARK